MHDRRRPLLCFHLADAFCLYLFMLSYKTLIQVLWFVILPPPRPLHLLWLWLLVTCTSIVFFIIFFLGGRLIFSYQMCSPVYCWEVTLMGSVGGWLQPCVRRIWRCSCGAFWLAAPNVRLLAHSHLSAEALFLVSTVNSFRWGGKRKKTLQTFMYIVVCIVLLGVRISIRVSCG